MPEQLNSIVAQQRLPDELIFADDGSIDESLEIAEFYKSEFEELGLDYLVYSSPENRGICAIANHAASLANHQLIHGIGSADRLNPDFFLKQHKAFELYPEAGLAFSDPLHFADSGGTNPNSFNIQADFKYFSPQESVDLLKNGLFISGFTTVFKKELWDKFGGLQEKFAHHSDWLLCLRCILAAGCVYIKGPIAGTRWRETGYAEKGVNNFTKQKPVLDEIAEVCKIDMQLRDFIVASNSIRWLGPHQNYLKERL